MRIFILLCLALTIGFCSSSRTHAQTFDPFYQTVVDDVSYDSVLTNLQQFEAHGVKEVGNNELNDTRDWIYNKYISYGYTNVRLDTFQGGGDELYNVVVTKTGTLYPNTFVIVDGHYDTKNGTGTNDNGSGTSVILETARLIKDINTEYSVRFIHFSGEEAGYLGSDHYVTDIVNPQNMQIRIVFNIDEVGGVAGHPNDTLKCESDQSYPSGNDAVSDAFTDTLMTLTELYSSLETIKTNAYGSDYVPFQQNGEIITGYYENDHNDHVHSSTDFLSNLDTSYVFEIAKAATASTMYFARAYDVSVLTNENNIQHRISVFPNPSHDNFHFLCPNENEVILSLYSSTGEMITEKHFTNSTSLDLHEFPSTIYFYKISGAGSKIIKSGILVKE